MSNRQTSIKYSIEKAVFQQIFQSASQNAEECEEMAVCLCSALLTGQYAITLPRPFFALQHAW